jgi:hypothetical protein
MYAVAPGVWDALLAPQLTLLSGTRRDVRACAQELAHHVVHTRSGVVLWCDGDHGFNPYDFAELNLTRGHQADHGAERVLVKRCMTPFQWDSVLTQHLDQKLVEVDAGLVLAAPFDRLFSTDELADWEQVDYVTYALEHLKALATRFAVPILLTVDMARWWHTHPELARRTYMRCAARWTVDSTAGRWRLVEDGTSKVLEEAPIMPEPPLEAFGSPSFPVEVVRQ